MARASRRHQPHQPPPLLQPLLLLLLLLGLLGTAPAFLLPPSSSPSSSFSSSRPARPPVAATTAGGGQQQTGAMEVVNVELGDRSYPIYIGPGLLTKGDAPLLTKHIGGKRALVVTNDVCKSAGGGVACLHAYMCDRVPAPPFTNRRSLNLFLDRPIEWTHPPITARGPAVPVHDQQGAGRRAAHRAGRGGAARRRGVQGD